MPIVTVHGAVLSCRWGTPTILRMMCLPFWHVAPNPAITMIMTGAQTGGGHTLTAYPAARPGSWPHSSRLPSAPSDCQAQVLPGMEAAASDPGSMPQALSARAVFRPLFPPAFRHTLCCLRPISTGVPLRFGKALAASSYRPRVFPKSVGTSF